MPKHLGLLLLAVSSGFALAQERIYAPSAADLKALDQHAVAFTGHHCEYDLRTQDPGAMSSENFVKLMNLFEQGARKELAKYNTAVFKSSLTDNNMYRTYTMSKKTNIGLFVLYFHTKGQMHYYGCKFKV